MNHLARFKAFYSLSSAGRYIINPEILWHAPEGMEYIVEHSNDQGKWLSDPWVTGGMLLTKAEAITLAAKIFASGEGNLPTRVVRIGRWVGRENSLLMVEVVKTFRTRRA